MPPAPPPAGGSSAPLPGRDFQLTRADQQFVDRRRQLRQQFRELDIVGSTSNVFAIDRKRRDEGRAGTALGDAIRQTYFQTRNHAALQARPSRLFNDMLNPPVSPPAAAALQPGDSGFLRPDQRLRGQLRAEAELGAEKVGQSTTDRSR